MSVTVHHADNRDVLATLADNSIDAVVTDPPYALVSIQKQFGKPGAAPAKGDVYARASAGFMGKQWDTGEVAFAEEFWAQVWRVLKPGGHLVAFSGTRTYHRMVVAIEDAGFEIRDQLAWVYGSGFPKSHDVAKGIDKHLGFERAKVRVRAPKNPPNLVGGIGRGGSRPWVEKALEQGFHEAASPEAASPEAAIWSGYGTALKPSWEPICLARKPLNGTVAENVLRWGVGALNIDGCRVGDDGGTRFKPSGERINGSHDYGFSGSGSEDLGKGRWPANVVHDGSPEVVAAFPSKAGGGSKAPRADAPSREAKRTVNALGDGLWTSTVSHNDSGSAARFFYSAKADREDRLGSKHPTVKPVDLMAWLVRMVCPPGGVVLDPFAGSGTTGLAAMREGRDCVLIEREDEYIADINRRIAWANGEGKLTAQELGKKQETVEALPLFGGAA